MVLFFFFFFQAEDGIRDCSRDWSSDVCSSDLTMPHIAYRKKTGNICLQQVWISVERPALGALPVSYKVGTRQDEPAFVALDDIFQPVGSRQRSNKDEHGTRRHALYFVGIRTKDGKLFQMRFAMRLGDAGVRPKLNVGRLLDLVDQILGHRAR